MSRDRPASHFHTMPRNRSEFHLLLRASADAKHSLDVARKRVANLEKKIAELDAQIEARGGVTHYPLRLPFRCQGEMQRAMFDLLRERGTATAADLAAVIGARYGLDMTNEADAYALRQRSCAACVRLERLGRVKQVGWSEGKLGRRGRFKIWAAR